MYFRGWKFVKKNIIVSILTALIVSLVVIFLMPSKLTINEDYYLIGGVIRNIGEGWELIDDSGHEPLGIDKVETTDDAVIIHYSKADKVVSLNVTPDETMAAEGYTMGASVGLDHSIINIYDGEGNLINPNDYTNDRGNIWINGIFKD